MFEQQVQVKLDAMITPLREVRFWETSLKLTAWFRQTLHLKSTLEDTIALEALEARLRAILPELYQKSYENVLPVSMGSASLKFGTDGKVVWNEMWATFCDLAMAGGPPHRGMLLEPAFPEQIAERPEKLQQVVAEICRGIGLVTGLVAEPSSMPGWVAIQCRSSAMAAWLVRAIVMENVLAHHHDEMLFLPAGPDFRLEKEIKNVVTAIAKTCHYWMGHVSPLQQRSIEQLFEAGNSKLLEPGTASDVQLQRTVYQTLMLEISENIRRGDEVFSFSNQSSGWMGVECPNVQTAVWLMRAMVASNILARREGVVLFLPLNPAADPHGQRLIRTFIHIRHLASVKNIL